MKIGKQITIKSTKTTFKDYDEAMKHLFPYIYEKEKKKEELEEEMGREKTMRRLAESVLSQF